MTPMMNATNRLSRITIGAMQDAGYTVDYTKADPFIPGLNAVVSPGNISPAAGSMLAARQAGAVPPYFSALASPSLVAMAAVATGALQQPTARGYLARIAAPRVATSANLTSFATALETAFGHLAAGR
jgi:hypothetical protein